MRYAIYYTPPPEHPLSRVAARWLGRDALSERPVEAAHAAPLLPEEHAFHTAAARRYGFHATLKAPFRLAEAETEASLIEALDLYAASRVPVRIDRVTLAQIDGYFAIVPAVATVEIDRMAGEIVVGFDRFRAPLSEDDLRRRSPASLTPRQLQNLHKWGYPHVFEAFRFHMTLTGRVANGEAARVRQAIETFFGPLLDQPLDVDTLALFHEPAEGAPFVLRTLHSLDRVRIGETA